MAKILIRTDDDRPLAERGIPDSALPKLQAIFGGATAADTCSLLLTWLVKHAREYARGRLLSNRAATDYVAVTEGQEQETAAFNSDWPQQ